MEESPEVTLCVQEAGAVASVGVPGKVHGLAEQAPEHLLGRRDWVRQNHPDPAVVCRLLQEDGQEEGGMHTAQEGGRHVRVPACGGVTGCQPWAGGRLQHQVRGLLRAEDLVEVHDRRYVAEGGHV